MEEVFISTNFINYKLFKKIKIKAVLIKPLFNKHITSAEVKKKKKANRHQQ